MSANMSQLMNWRYQKMSTYEVLNTTMWTRPCLKTATDYGNSSPRMHDLLDWKSWSANYPLPVTDCICLMSLAFVCLRHVHSAGSFIRPHNYLQVISSDFGVQASPTYVHELLWWRHIGHWPWLFLERSMVDHLTPGTITLSSGWFGLTLQTCYNYFGGTDGSHVTQRKIDHSEKRTGRCYRQTNTGVSVRRRLIVTVLVISLTLMTASHVGCVFNDTDT